MEIVRSMKEHLCYAAMDFDQELDRSTKYVDMDKSYELPDGSTVTVGNER